VIILALIVVVLGLINYIFALDRFLRVPLAPLSGLREVWLPILFLLCYALCWLGWYLWRLLGPDQELSAFPDIDLAWEEALRALSQADIDPRQVPLFLVLGRPAAGENALFQASQLSFQVRQAPNRIDSPLYVYASREAIYLSCAGASILGRQATILAGEGAAEVEGIPPESESAPEFESESAPDEGRPNRNATMISPRDFSSLEGPRVLATSAAMTAFPGDRGAGEEAVDSGLETSFEIFACEVEPGPLPQPGLPPAAPPPAPVAARPRSPRPEGTDRPRQSLVKNADEVERLADRLRHLCLLIARERRPYCPINGILLLVPLEATGDDADMKETASLCQRELTMVHEALQVNSPIFSVLCDLERTPGYGEFHRHFPDEQRERLLGQSFPLVPDLDATARLRKIDEGVQWIGNVLIPSLVYKLWRVDSRPRTEGTAATTANIRLFRFLAEVRARQRRFSRIVTRGLVGSSQGPLMLGGCYLASTGRDPDREQGFVASVFRYLLENQNYVAWTPAALQEEAEYRRWTTLGYLGLAAITALLALILIASAWRSS
jgi:hypothetical protein